MVECPPRNDLRVPAVTDAVPFPRRHTPKLAPACPQPGPFLSHSNKGDCLCVAPFSPESRGGATGTGRAGKTS